MDLIKQTYGTEAFQNALYDDLGITNRDEMWKRMHMGFTDVQKYHDTRITLEKRFLDSHADHFAMIMEKLNNAGIPAKDAKVLAIKATKKAFQKDWDYIEKLYPEKWLGRGIARLSHNSPYFDTTKLRYRVTRPDAAILPTVVESVESVVDTIESTVSTASTVVSSVVESESIPMPELPAPGTTVLPPVLGPVIGSSGSSGSSVAAGRSQAKAEDLTPSRGGDASASRAGGLPPIRVVGDADESYGGTLEEDSEDVYKSMDSNVSSLGNLDALFDEPKVDLVYEAPPIPPPVPPPVPTPPKAPPKAAVKAPPAAVKAPPVNPIEELAQKGEGIKTTLRKTKPLKDPPKRLSDFEKKLVQQQKNNQVQDDDIPESSADWEEDTPLQAKAVENSEQEVVQPSTDIPDLTNSREDEGQFNFDKTAVTVEAKKEVEGAQPEILLKYKGEPVSLSQIIVSDSYDSKALKEFISDLGYKEMGQGRQTGDEIEELKLFLMFIYNQIAKTKGLISSDYFPNARYSNLSYKARKAVANYRGRNIKKKSDLVAFENELKDQEELEKQQKAATKAAKKAAKKSARTAKQVKGDDDDDAPVEVIKPKKGAKNEVSLDDDKPKKDKNKSKNKGKAKADD